MSRNASNALFADIMLGEPPERFDPTALMGKWISSGRARHTKRIGARGSSNRASFAEGALLVGSGIALVALAAAAVEKGSRRLPRSLGDVVNGFALKPALSLRTGIAAARRVQYALDDGELQKARELLGRHLVSRDTSALTEDEVAGAAIESVAQHLSDSVVAPLFAFRLGGLGAAYAYRFINTADAMLGYHNEELEWFGKAAARVDDVANFIPARLTAALICVAAPSARGSVKFATRITFRDAKNSVSPNAGWPMAAMAGALDVRLAKSDQYEFNRKGYSPIPRDIARACRIALAVSASAAVAVDMF